ncbi:tetratricopeptide repeat protein [Rhodobacteraceae bacterium B1Z28]|uniref:Tetratricopeptide repeat protein n=1 Tax=Ruegeria haliotis TaxID=2747601 RepID=A0ABX2PQD1_9RHOB|nr:tetratricopeptide repeat protein [Ruegeria haliotis]NVO56334.1 tetratricopeptide repeat protein [Ruegeria haliotis]
MSISDQDIRAQLRRLMDHPEFPASPQRRAFLTYVVDEYLAGRADQIKGVSIAMSVFNRDASFDQQIDPIVRLEARRLRQDIDSYYAGPGRDDPMRLSIPKGGYAPRFEQVAHPKADPVSDEVLRHEEPAPHRSSRTIWVLAGAAMICGVIWIGLSFLGAAPGRDPDLPKGPIVAVLPFESLGEAPESLAYGITQQLTTELVRFRDLWVLPLGTVERFRDSQIDPQQLRSEFDADYALEGSVQETGETLRLSARLIDLTAARYVWVRSYEIGLAPSEIYAVQDQIIRDVTGQLAGKYGLLTQDAMQLAARTAPAHRDAYDCVLEYYSYQITINLDQHGDVKACILNAVDQNPEYAEAWAVLSNLYVQQVRFNLGGDRDQVLQAADLAARRAIQADPNLATGHLMLANLLFVEGDIQGFRQAGQRAVDLNPNDGAILAHFGMRLAFAGDWDRGLAIGDRAIALNPVHPHWYHFPRVFYLFDQGDFDQALSVLDRIDMPEFFWTHLWRAALNHEIGDEAQAEAALEALLNLQPNFAVKAPDILSIWQLDDLFKQKLMNSLHQAGLSG